MGYQVSHCEFVWLALVIHLCGCSFSLCLLGKWPRKLISKLVMPAYIVCYHPDSLEYVSMLFLELHLMIFDSPPPSCSRCNLFVLLKECMRHILLSCTLQRQSQPLLYCFSWSYLQWRLNIAVTYRTEMKMNASALISALQMQSIWLWGVRCASFVDYFLILLHNRPFHK